jgi:single-strand DNA-binding protein
MPAKQGAAPAGSGTPNHRAGHKDGYKDGHKDGQRDGEGTAEQGPASSPRVLSGDSADNTVLLRGRVSSAPLERELPSGALITTFRLSIARASTPMTTGSRQTGDWIDCTAWTARTRRIVGGWAEGDRVEVSGALRRRFYRLGSGPSTRVEVEVLSARRARARPVPE